MTLRLRRWGQRVTVWAAAVLITLLVGFSRLYLGAHWLTDVLGGYALGAAWTALVVTTVTTLGQGVPPASRVRRRPAADNRMQRRDRGVSRRPEPPAGPSDAAPSEAGRGVEPRM
jgi:hypothetical protein